MVLAVLVVVTQQVLVALAWEEMAAHLRGVLLRLAVPTQALAAAQAWAQADLPLRLEPLAVPVSSLPAIWAHLLARVAPLQRVVALLQATHCIRSLARETAHSHSTHQPPY